MITFKFDKKTGKYEWKSAGFLDKNHLIALKAMSVKGYATYETLAAVFPGPEGDLDEEDKRYQLFHDILWRLKDLGLVVWKKDESVLVFVDKKDYKNNKCEKVTADFLTSTGKAFCQSIGLKQVSLYD